jgi:hypothetical protein
MKCCVNCGQRLSVNERRPVHAKSMRWFFSIRLYPTALECDAYICGKCRFIFNQWKALSEFSELVSIIDGFDEVCSGTGDQIEGKSQNNLCFEMTVKELLFSG